MSPAAGRPGRERTHTESGERERGQPFLVAVSQPLSHGHSSLLYLKVEGTCSEKVGNCGGVTELSGKPW